MSDRFPRVQGRCPSCGLAALFLGEGGHLTCSNLNCDDPDVMHALEARKACRFTPGDTLEDGSVFIGYAEDDIPMWAEPVTDPHALCCRSCRAAVAPDGQWTVEDGRANSSAEYHEVVAHVERLIRDDAHKLIGGHADMTAGLIVSQLAWKYGMRPSHVAVQV